MAIPDQIRIRYEAGYHTRFIGTYDRGRKQFMAFVVASFTTPTKRNRVQRKQWYAVLHTFDKAGNHLQTQASYAGDTTPGGEDAVVEKAQAKRTEMLESLGKYTLKDVRVKLFSVTIDGHRFGLEDTTDDERGESVTLWPNDLFFTPPWNGTYST
ncbi:MAG TPA: hypothetical protein VKE74_25365 [Gemmataceae bacterium]|nr:hypothetical protein [Gemmataceae bacterium]